MNNEANIKVLLSLGAEKNEKIKRELLNSERELLNSEDETKLTKLNSCTEETEENICTICRESLSEKDVTSFPCACKNMYHEKCLHDWLIRNSTCPTCRKTLPKLLSKITLDEAFNEKSWDLAKEILLKMPKGSINLTGDPDINLFNIALENDQRQLVSLLLEKNEDKATEESSDEGQEEHLIIKPETQEIEEKKESKQQQKQTPKNTIS
jgi:HRD ubiquitin ligase complex, ER membrane component